MRLAVDTGGTFTDLVIEDGDRLYLFKAPTTPANPIEGIIDVIDVAANGLSLSRQVLLQRTELFVHGTTTATNAIVTGRTAKTAFLTTAGHPDILVLREGGRIGLPLFDYSIEYPKPYVPRALTFEIPERVGPDGQVLLALDEAVAREVIEWIAGTGVQAIAVCLLWSIVNPGHELRLEALIKELLPEIAVSLSHRVNPSLREYRRASATAIDASLKPIMGRYLGGLESRLRQEGYAGRLLVVTSQGMMKDAAEVAAAPIHAVKSGPAMAPVAGRHFATIAGLGDVAIVADTGGTTYDVALVRHGRIPETRETWIGRPYLGHMTGFPSIDIRSVGAGGGSIARVDEAGLLHVGPDSAGAVPGPACYGRGGDKPTVTDAALALGHIDPDFFLGGRMKLDLDLARRAIDSHVANPLDMSVEAAAAAILALVTETMAGAIEDITVNQGIDPRGAVLVGGGGAAGLNSVAIARRLHCGRVLFPDAGAALSAAGGLLCALSEDFSEFRMATSRQFDFAAVNAGLARLQSRVDEFLASAGNGVASQVEFSVEARYAQQIWEIKVPLRRAPVRSDEDLAALVEDFHKLHREIFAFDDPHGEIEFVNWRALVACELRRQPLGRIGTDGHGAKSSVTRRRAWFSGQAREVPVHEFDALPVGQRHVGPAIVETPFTTIVMDPQTEFWVDQSGGLIAELKRANEEVLS
ncbi:methylhydantoinase [Hypericibacter terrae]|uniref:Methylhydantoinase n=1 Tax=Hypericibacter terrae TaxID=2602015 RepID=A0A5J6MCG1_9PROT|nr:hydantoinase/oxoprolinase family protein [Hypericibacter terrae]QEX14983.1 methylhydantoinase [Hypericibacter terrae]